MKMRKDNVIKDISENLVSIYKNLGWEIVKEGKKTPITPSNSNFGQDNK